jgi:TonB family protein
MKKILLFILITQFIVTSTFSQSSLDEFNQIQKFLETTVQVPYMANAVNVQDKVIIRITMGSDMKPPKYEVIKSIRTDCDKEALRVVKLINANNLLQALNGKNSIDIDVPFYTKEKLLYEDEAETIFYDEKGEKRFNIKDAKYAFHYDVDTVSGLPLSDISIWDIKNGKVKSRKTAKIKVDSSTKYQSNAFGNFDKNLKIISYSFSTEMGILSWHTFEDDYPVFIKIGNQTRSFYPSGRIHYEILTFSGKDGEKQLTTTWFPNGQVEHQEEVTYSSTNFLKNILKLASWDTLGKQLVYKRNGYDVDYAGTPQDWVCHKGLIKDGQKDGKWVGTLNNGKTDYIEFYKNGILERGTTYTDNDSTQYNTFEEQANFESGMPGFGSFLQNNLRYPIDAQRANAQGKVYLQFVVCTDGTLCDFDVLKSVGYGCDEEAIRVLQLSSGKWKPGKQRGKEVRSRFTIPINYKLTRRLF